MGLYHIAPPDGQMTLAIQQDGSVPSPQNWVIGFSYGAEFTPENGKESARPELAIFLEELESIGIKVDHVETSSLTVPPDYQFTETITLQDTWFDTGNPPENFPVTVTEPTTGSSLTLQCHIRGTNPPRPLLSTALDTDLLRALCWLESGWHQFGDDGMPKTNHNTNGTTDWGCCQINQATHRQQWQWTANVAAAKALLNQKQATANRYLSQHPPVTNDMMLRETIQLYNGGHYYQWNSDDQTWDAEPPSNYVATVLRFIADKPWQSGAHWLGRYSYDF